MLSPQGALQEKAEISGACSCAVDTSTRNPREALVEQNAVASGDSSASTRRQRGWQQSTKRSPSDIVLATRHLVHRERMRDRGQVGVFGTR